MPRYVLFVGAVAVGAFVGGYLGQVVERQLGHLLAPGVVTGAGIALGIFLARRLAPLRRRSQT